MENGSGEKLSGIDLSQILSMVFGGNSSLRPLRELAEAHQEHSLIMRRSVLRAEAELLKGLISVVEEELKRVDAEIDRAGQAPIGREKITLD